MSLLPIICRCGHAHETCIEAGKFSESCTEAECACTAWMPAPVGGAKASDGTELVLYECVDGTSRIGFGPEGEGPYHRVAGCPNCGKYAGEWRSDIAFFAALNSGRNPDEPCSRVCALQLEWQAEVAAKRLTEARPS